MVVVGDEDHLRQAVANLVANALAPHPGGHAHRGRGGAAATARRPSRSATTAPGLDDEALRHVFDRFWQADRARVGAGAGLGLSIVAAIADEHGGSVGASNADGGGARFVLSLPPSSPTNGHRPRP